MLIRKLRQKLVMKFPPCHAAHKQWGWDETTSRPLHVQLFPLHHKVLHCWILSIPPLTLSNRALDRAENNLDRTSWSPMIRPWALPKQHCQVAKSSGFKADYPASNSCSTVASCVTWAQSSTSLCLRFPICKMKTMITPTS